MLQSKCVYDELLELLKFVMKKETIKPFKLVGGTALALQKEAVRRILLIYSIFSKVSL